MTLPARPADVAPRIRSFVRREGRLTPAQGRALTELLPRFGLSVDLGPRDFSSRFGRRAPLVVEIGFGAGEALLHACQTQPEFDFVGIEVHRPGVGRLLAGAAALELQNLAVYCDDAIDVLSHCFGDESIEELRIYFPDPWPKKRHNKRRLIDAAFLDLIAPKLAVGGRLHYASDWQPYAEEVETLLSLDPRFRAAGTEGARLDRPAWRAPTRFENRGLKLGHQVTDLLWQRAARPDA